MLLPAVSVNRLPLIWIVFAPCPVGVNVAVYVVPEPLKPERLPPVTLISPTSKSVVDSFDVNVRDKDPSLVDAPLAASAEVMLIVGSVVSIVRFGSEAEEDLTPETLVDVTVRLV